MAGLLAPPEDFQLSSLQSNSSLLPLWPAAPAGDAQGGFELNLLPAAAAPKRRGPLPLLGASTDNDIVVDPGSEFHLLSKNALTEASRRAIAEAIEVVRLATASGTVIARSLKRRAFTAQGAAQHSSHSFAR